MRSPCDSIRPDFPGRASPANALRNGSGIIATSISENNRRRGIFSAPREFSPRAFGARAKKILCTRIVARKSAFNAPNRADGEPPEALLDYGFLKEESPT